jgi:hypothetical protein
VDAIGQLSNPGDEGLQAAALDPRSSWNQGVRGAPRTSIRSADEFMGTIVTDRPPGTICRYNSADTQALGTLLVAATGRSITDYMHEKLVEPLGFEFDSYWLTDHVGMESAYAGLMMTPLDYAKFGELYRCGGTWNGAQVVPADWVARSVVTEGQHTQPGRR